MARRFLSVDTGLCEVWTSKSTFGIIYLFFYSEDSLKRLGQDVSSLDMSKYSLGWDLVALERAVQATREDQSDSDDEELESETPALL